MQASVNLNTAETVLKCMTAHWSLQRKTNKQTIKMVEVVVVVKVYRLTEVGASSTRRKLIAHGDVTHGAMAQKIFKKIMDLAMRIELTMSILMP